MPRRSSGIRDGRGDDGDAGAEHAVVPDSDRCVVRYHELIVGEAVAPHRGVEAVVEIDGPLKINPLAAAAQQPAEQGGPGVRLPSKVWLYFWHRSWARRLTPRSSVPPGVEQPSGQNLVVPAHEGSSLSHRSGFARRGNLSPAYPFPLKRASPFYSCICAVSKATASSFVGAKKTALPLLDS